MSLAQFTSPVREWFAAAFESPTDVQLRAWPQIAAGNNVLISAPTGSGKTLAAFLAGLDQLAQQPLADSQRRVRLLYISPLKALSHDVERNLRAPLLGITASNPDLEIKVALRTGDTPQKERQAMLRKPPDVLITTPESLYLMLTSKAREILSGVETVIIDEIHAVAGTKRGTHLALTLERLSALREATGGDLPGSWVGTDVQRIGLSATQKPLDEIGRFLVGGKRSCELIEATDRKELDLRIVMPVEDSEPLADPAMALVDDEFADDPLGDPAGRVGQRAYVPGGEQTVGNSIWPAMYPMILDLVQEHRSTIVFVNSRRSAERLALRLNELAEQRQLAALGLDSSPLASPDQSATLPSAERHAQISPRPKQPLTVGAPEEGSTTAASTGQNSTPESVRTPTGPHAVEIARAHHGSLSREERTTVEELLKAGELPCLVATSSLELGIDMGAVDLVLQIESPKSVSAGLQRIGRAGHGVGETARGRIFPKFKADLLECAVVVKRMREGKIESTTIPKNPLDVLAQQIVAIVASADEEDGLAADDLFALITRAYPYAELPRELFERVLDMLDGRYPSQEFAELRARIVWDRISGTIRPRQGSGRLAIANAGTIPDRGLYRVTLPDGRKVGELDEEMVYEARAGQTFLLGASTWRIEEIQRDRVVVTPAPGVPGSLPFWKGDQRGRPLELGRAIGEFSRWAVSQKPQELADGYDLEPDAAAELVEFLNEQQAATGVLPSDKAVVVERFKDEIGDWRICVLTPFGGRVHSGWGLAISARIRNELGLEASAIWSDDGIIIHLPDIDEEDGWEDLLDLLTPAHDEVEDLIVSELGKSALFGARFRENAARALLIPRAQPGRRTPLWQQRLKSQALLEVATKYSDFPVILETYRECLRDVLDLPGLVEILRQLQAGEIALVHAQTPSASPMAGSLLFDYIATYMYEGDAPNAERRAAALSLDRDLLRELLGQDELRDLLDEGALAQLEADLQHRSERTRAKSPDSLAEVLRRVGDLTLEEVAQRIEPLDNLAALQVAGEWLDELAKQRRAVKLRIGGEERWIAADDAGLYRDSVAAMPPQGLPDSFLSEVPDALRRVVIRYAATNGPFTERELRRRLGVDVAPTLRELQREDQLVKGHIRPNPPPPAEIEWCNPDVLRRLRRMSLAVLRQEIEAVEPRALVPFSLGWQGIDRYRAGRADPNPPDRLREILVPLQGVALPVQLWESQVLPRRLGFYSPAWLDALCASGEVVWVGAGGSGGPSGTKVALYFREDAPSIGPPIVKASEQSAFDSPAHQAVRAQLLGRPAFFAELQTELPEHIEHLSDALWDLIGAGEVTCDVFAPLRAGRPKKPGVDARTVPPVRSAIGHRRISGRRRFGPRGAGTAASSGPPQGRFSLTAPLFEIAPGQPATDQIARRRTLAELLLERYGVVTREHIRSESIPGGFSLLYDSFSALETLGICRRGYFVEGLGGAQFALPSALERLRGQSLSDPGSATDSSGQPLAVTILDAAEPAQLYGSILPWPKLSDAQLASRPEDASEPRPQRSQGSQVVFVGPDPVIYCDRAGKSVQTLAGYEDPRIVPALSKLANAAAESRLGTLGRKGLHLERIDGLSVIGHPLEALLRPAGFSQTPTKYVARP